MADAPQKYTPMQEAFLDALVSEAKGDIRSAMRIAGYSDSTTVKDVVGPLKNEIIQRTAMMLALNSPKAAMGLVEVLDDPARPGNQNRISAAKELLDRSGLVKKEQVTVETKGGGMFILPPKKSESDDELAD